MPAFDLDSFLPYRLSVIASRASAGFAAQCASEGISNAEWRVIAHLSQAPKISVRDIQKRTELEKSNVSRAVARLERDGFVSKSADADDHRLLSIQLTAKGKRKLTRLAAAAKTFQDDALGTLSTSQQQQVDSALALLSSALEGQVEP